MIRPKVRVHPHPKSEAAAEVLQPEDAVSEAVAPVADVVAAEPAASQWPIVAEFEVPANATGSESYFQLKRGYKKIKYNYLRRLAELRGRTVTLTMSISAPAGAPEDSSNG